MLLIKCIEIDDQDKLELLIIYAIIIIIDEWLLVNTKNIKQQDILEILEKRYRIHSTIFCSQFDIAGWHFKLGGAALADAILDRITPKSHIIKINEINRCVQDKNTSPRILPWALLSEWMVRSIGILSI